jgi:hypothetical protein
MNPTLPLLVLALSAAATTAFAAAPDATESPFGVSSSAASTRNFKSWAPAVSKLGVKWVRGFDTFNDIEPQPGKWNWKGVDHELDVAAGNRLQLSGFFLYGNPWIPSPSGLPITNLPAWTDYVSRLVKHVDGGVKYWEVWNEPPNFTTNASPADYATLVRATYDAAHAADPSCHIGLAAQSVNLNYLDQALQAGAADHFDYLTLHPYEVLGTVSDGGEAEFMSIVPTVRKMLAARDPARANVPIWFTEIGASLGQMNGLVKVTPGVQAQLLIKAYAMGLAEGVARIDWFEGREGDSGPMGLLDAQGKPRPAAAAMAKMQEMLGDTPVFLGWELLHERDYAFVFQGAKETVMITWAPPGVTDEIEMGDDVEIDNPGGDDELSGGALEVTNEPAIISGKIPLKYLDAAQANKDKPFPWGGDYSHAGSISVALGSPNVAKGLHQLYANATSSPVAIDGKPARDCGRAAAQSFVVDPSFLSYSSVPITITAMVRRNAAGDHAGFNLKYESATGWKSAGRWNSIPAGTSWTKLTWAITDPQFVGKWGFNFSFDSDTAAQAKYELQSVTVTKTAP